LFLGAGNLAFGNGQTFTAKANGNWNAAGTWTTAGAETYPGQDGSTNDIVIIPNFNVTVNIINATCGTIEFTNAGGSIKLGAAADQLTVGSGTAGQIYGTTAGTVTVNAGSLIINGYINETTAIAVAVTSGSAILNAATTTTTMSANAAISLTSGSIKFNGALTQSNGTISTSSGTISFNGNVTQSAGTISGTGTSIINFATGTTVAQSGTGVISCTRGALNFNGTCVVTQTVSKITCTGSGAVTFGGTVTQSGAGTISNTSSGIMTFNNTVLQSSTGTISTASTGTLNFNANVTQSAGGTISSSNTSVINFATGITVLQSGSGTISCTNGSINFNGTCTFSQPAAATGLLNCINGGSINFSTTSTFSQVATGATAEVAGTGTMTFANTAGFTHNGLIEVQGGTIIFDGPVTTAASATIENITTAGALTFAEGYTDNGTFNCSTKSTTIKFGGNVTCATGATFTFFKTSTTTFTGNFTTSPTLTPPTAGVTFGNVIIGVGGNGVDVTLAASISVAGTWANNSGVVGCLTGATSDVTFTSTATTIGGTNGTTFPHNVNISNSAAITFSLPTAATNKSYTVTNNLNLNTAGNATSMTLAANTTLTVTNTLTTAAGSSTGDIVLKAGSTLTATTVIISAATGNTTITQNANTTFSATTATINQPAANNTTNDWKVNSGTASITTLNFIASSNTANRVILMAVTTGTLNVTTVNYSGGINTVPTSVLCEQITLTTGTINFTNSVAETSGTISVTTGTINFNGGYVISGANSIFTNTGAANIKFGGNFTCSATKTPGVTFFSSTSSALSSTETFTGNSTVTPTTQITFGNLTINSSETVTLSGAGITVKGNWIDNGTFTAGSQAVTFSANYTPQTLTASSGTETFYGLTTNLAAAADVLQLASTNVLVTSLLTMTQGDINLNTSTLQVGNASNAVTTLTYTAGTAYGGTFARWWPIGAITIAGSSYGLFPVGIQGTTRKLTIVSSVSPTSAGLVSAIHNDPPPLETIIADIFTDNLGNAVIDISVENTTVTTDGSGGVGGTFTVMATYGGFDNPGGTATINDYSLETYTSSVNGYTSLVTTGAETNGGTVATPTVQRAGLAVKAGAIDNAHPGIANVYVCGTKNIETPIEAIYYSVNAASTSWSSATEWSITAGAVACPCVAVPSTAGSFIIQNGDIVSLPAGTTTCGNLQIKAGELTNAGASTLNDNGILYTTAGATAYISTNATSTLNVTGTASFLGSGTYAMGALSSGGAGLTVGAGATSVTASGNVTVTGGISINANTTLSGANTLTETGDVTIASGTTLTTGTGVASVISGNLTVSGTLAVGTGELTQSGAAVALTGTGSITGTGIFQVKNITTSYTINSSVNMSIAPEFLITGAITILNNGFINLTNATNSLDGSVVGSIWQQQPNSTLKISGSTIPFSTNGVLDPSAFKPNLVAYNKAGNQTIAAPGGSNALCSCAAYDSLTVAISGTKSITSNISVGSGITINDAAILSEGTHILSDLNSFGLSGAVLKMNGSASPESGLAITRSSSGTYPELTGAYILNAGLIAITATGVGTVVTLQPLPSGSSAGYYNLLLGGSASFNLSQGGNGTSLADSLTIENSATLSTIAGGLTVTSALNYTSSGATTLDDALTVPGNTTISAGTLGLGSKFIAGAAGTAQTATAGNVTITGTGTLNDNGNEIDISGNWTQNTGATYTSTGLVVFNSDSTQAIGGTIAANKFFDLTINNSIPFSSSTYAVTLGTPVTVKDNLGLTLGVLNSTGTNLLTIGQSGVYPEATSDPGSITSYVDGPMAVYGPDPFTFPVGNQGIYAQLSIEGGGVSSASTFSNGIDNGTTATKFQGQYSLSASPNYSTASYIDGNGNVGFAASPVQDYNNEGLDHTSQIEYWTLNNLSNLGEQNYVLMTSNYPAQSAITNLSDLAVAHYDLASPGTGLWENIGPDLAGSVGSTVTAESSIELTDLNINPILSWGSKHGPNALPIQLTSFTSVCQNYTALLQWSTATESNNDYFTIDKTQDGNNYQTIAIVKGAGTSVTPHNYSAVDESPYSGTAYYRISQTDFDGKTTGLNTSVYVPCENENQINAFAVNTSITAEINATESGPYTLVLYNTLGQAVYTKTINASLGLNAYTLLPNTGNGLYVLRITGKNSVYTKKMVLGY